MKNGINIMIPLLILLMILKNMLTLFLGIPCLIFFLLFLAIIFLSECEAENLKDKIHFILESLLLSGLLSLSMSICYWIILSGAKTVEEVTKDSSSWGNFKRGGTAETGSCEEWCANNIYDLAGNVSEFTFRSTGICSRGGNRYRCSGRKNIVSTSCGRDETNYTGFRIALCIK